MAAILFTVIYDVLQVDKAIAHRAPRHTTNSMDYIQLGSKNVNNINFHLGLNLSQRLGAWCPTSGEPLQSSDSLRRPAERNVQQNGNHNTLSSPRLLLKAFTVHWVRHAAKHR